MSITNFIKGKSLQTVVYWGTPVNDGRGRFTFATPEEVLVRWEDAVETISKDNQSRIRIDKDGKEYVSRAKILTANIPSTDWNLDGYVYLGTLTSVASNPVPYDVDDAHEIKEIKKLTSLNDATLVSYVIYL